MGVLYARVAGAWVPVGGGGSGADEVHVGPDQPADTLELWVDTDETAPLPDDSRWNTAWGQVGYGQGPGSDIASIGSSGQVIPGMSVTFTTVPGRRYRTTMFVNVGVRAGAPLFVSLAARDVGGTTLVQTAQNLQAGDYETMSLTYVDDAGSTAATRTYQCHLSCNTGTIDYIGSFTRQGYIVVEDIGPIAGAAPALMSTTDRWNTAWGVAIARANADTSVNSTTPVTLFSLTGNLIAGRRYAVRLGQNSGYGSTLGDIWEFGANLDGTLISNRYYQIGVANHYITPFEFDMPFTATTGSHTIAIYAKRAGGTGTLQARIYAEVVDVGPVSGAAPADPTPAWLPLPLINGWTQVGGWSTARYRKVGDEVRIEGHVAAPGSNGILAVLPPGYRPPNNIQWPAMCYSAGSVSYGWLSVFTSGNVEVGYNTYIPAESTWPINCPPFTVTP